jgi:hypothetical protein
METTMRNIFSSTIIVGLAAVLLAGGVASAQTTKPDALSKAPRVGWMSVGAIVAKIEGQGYSVHGIEIDDDAYEVKAVDANGVRVEANLDPSTGEQLSSWKQDD